MKMFNHIALFALYFLLPMLDACAKPDSPAGQGGGSAADIEYYGFSPRVADSEIYSVKANGQEIKVFPTDEPHIAWVGAADGVSVKFEVRLKNGVIKKADVRPLGKKYDFSIAGGKFAFELKQYDRVSVEINGDIENPLFIFVNPIDAEKPSKNDPSVRYFEAGKIYDAGDIRLSADCREVYLEPGTYVKGNILGVNVPGVRIHGGGLLSSVRNKGSYDEFYQTFGVALYGCEDARLDDITSVFAGAGWSSLFANCHNSVITNYKALGLSNPDSKSERTVNNDSMDIIGGKNVRVSKCFLRGHDDAYCIKSQKFKLKGAVDGVWFEDCIGWNVGAGNTFEIGYECQIDIKNVHYKDIYAIHSGTSGTDMRRAALSIHNGAAGTVSDVTYENAYIEDAQEFAIWLACLSHNYNIGFEDDGTTPLKYSPGRIRNVSYRNIHVMNVRSGKGGCVIRGYDKEHNVSGISFENFDYLGKKVTSIEDPVWKEKKNYDKVSFK